MIWANEMQLVEKIRIEEAVKKTKELLRDGDINKMIAGTSRMELLTELRLWPDGTEE